MVANAWSHNALSVVSIAEKITIAVTCLGVRLVFGLRVDENRRLDMCETSASSWPVLVARRLPCYERDQARRAMVTAVVSIRQCLVSFRSPWRHVIKLTLGHTEFIRHFTVCASAAINLYQRGDLFRAEASPCPPNIRHHDLCFDFCLKGSVC